VPKWEYQGWEVEFDQDDVTRGLVVGAVNDETVRESRPLWSALNEAGQQGWELVAMTREPTLTTEFLLVIKRQIPE
jgi:hypothetical protein